MVQYELFPMSKIIKNVKTSMCYANSLKEFSQLLLHIYFCWLRQRVARVSIACTATNSLNTLPWSNNSGRQQDDANCVDS